MTGNRYSSKNKIVHNLQTENHSSAEIAQCTILSDKQIGENCPIPMDNLSTEKEAEFVE